MRCAKCGNVFSDNGTQYCSPAHRRQHERKAKLCATPEKKVYASVDAAWKYIASRPEEKLFKNSLAPYTDCTCKAVHIGHRKNAPSNPFA